jgi:hypothetical protein
VVEEIAAYRADTAKTTKFDKGLNGFEVCGPASQDTEKFMIRWEPMKITAAEGRDPISLKSEVRLRYTVNF